MPNIFEHLNNAAKILQSSGIEQPRREAASLLAFALKKDKTFLISHPEYKLSNVEEKRFRRFLKRRALREPFQYITGKQEFYGLDFLVTPDVLIPRPETELIVENAVEILRGKEHARFCEVGVGSGCISVSILHEIKSASAIGFDISGKALKIAKKNAVVHRVLERLELKISDVFEKLRDEKFDLIVSNPPYVSSEDIKNLQAEVRDFEPLMALTDDGDGVSIIERIITGAPTFLNNNGFLLLEIGIAQASRVSAMFSPQIWKDIDIFPDLQGIARMVKAQTGK
ncbi:MAG: peptide chain release factor N(5)-glutamine methyltransferase [Acidobacteriota bacterium]|nr:peptide chain release factor N(5)-glutamine methyltransferase [Acidobacteriota bacterium]